MSDVKTFKSQVFVTPKVRAVFPHLQEVDRFGSYSIDIDALTNADVVSDILANAKVTLVEAQQSLETDRHPTNSMVRVGEYKDVAFERLAFKMKGTKKVKGKEVEVHPTILDAGKKPVTELIYGGSLVKVAYYIQYTIMPTGTYLSVKLKGVQVIEHVGPGGETSCEDSFGVEEGFQSAGEEADVPVPPSAETDGSGSDPISKPKDF